MTRFHATVTALVLLLAGGFLHGLTAERWRQSAALDQAAARVADVPLAFGDWQAQPEASDDESFEQAGARGYWTRTYTHRRTQTRLLVILMCGRAGRMAVHTPQVCYRGAGYEMPDDPVRLPIAGDAFWTALFSKANGVTSNLRLYWAWKAAGDWQAADNPRWQFRGAPYLYKLYVAHDLTAATAAEPAADAAAGFLQQFLPELAQTLCPPAARVD